MSARNVALFIHLLGVVTIFIAIGIVQRVGAQIRSATTIEELRIWMRFVRTTSTMFPVGFVLLLLSGLYLADLGFSFDTPWVVVGIVSLLTMLGIGRGVMGRGLQAIGKGAVTASSITPELAAGIARPATWIAAGAVSGLAMAMLWLMVNKPGWGQSVVVALGLFVVGAVAGSATARKK